VAYFDVLANDDDMKAMLEISDGSRRVPVIVDGENIAIGFGGRS
jgi:glutaredoxin